MADRPEAKDMNLIDRSTVDQAYGHQAVEKAHQQPLREGHAPVMMTGPQGPPPPNTPSGQPSAQGVPQPAAPATPAGGENKD